MNVFLAGVGCVGKTAIGACLAQRLGWPFFDLDVEIEKHFGKPIERLREEHPTPFTFRRECASVVVKKLIQEVPPSGFVMALMPSGLMDSIWAALKKVDHYVVALQDSPESILARITFYDAESRPITKLLPARRNCRTNGDAVETAARSPTGRAFPWEIERPPAA